MCWWTLLFSFFFIKQAAPGSYTQLPGVGSDRQLTGLQDENHAQNLDTDQAKDALMPKQLTGSLPVDYMVFHQVPISLDEITGLVCV